MHKEIRTKQVKYYFVVLEKENISLIPVFILFSCSFVLTQKDQLNEVVS